MDRAWMDVLVELRVGIAAAAGLALLTTGCADSSEVTCREQGAGCLSDTTTTGSETEWEFGSSDDGGDFPEDDDTALVQCVPKPADECPARESECIAEIMEKRHFSHSCGCVDGLVFESVVDGPDPAVTDACCYTIKLSYSGCVEGRPLVVDGTMRTAPVLERADWSFAIDSMALDGVEGREAEGRAWLEAARMEHASIAAFARVILQLCALGAPAELVDATQRALADEIHHARISFAVASVLLAMPLGPGPIALDGGTAALDDVGAFADDLLAGGCLGETAAAARARIASVRAPRPQLSAILQRIADDEAEHAALAFRTLRWLVSSPAHAGATRSAIARFASALSGQRPVAEPDDVPGISGLSPAERTAITHRVAVDAVLPLLAAV